MFPGVNSSWKVFSISSTKNECDHIVWQLYSVRFWPLLSDIKADFIFSYTPWALPLPSLERQEAYIFAVLQMLLYAMMAMLASSFSK